MRRAEPFALLAGLWAAAALTPTAAADEREPLTRSQLRSCVVREEALGRRHDQLAQDGKSHDAEGEKISAEAVELSKLLRKLDSSDKEAVARYNQRNRARNSAVQGHNRQAEAFSLEQDKLKADEADFILACVAHPFMQDDEDAVLKELGLKERRYDRAKKKTGPNPSVTPEPSKMDPVPDRSST